MIRLLAVDIDGTLLDSRGRLPDAHRRALEDALAAGVTLVLVTGRSFHFTGQVTDALDLPATVILNNGAVVKHRDGTTLMRHPLPREVARHVLDGAPHFTDSVAIVFDRDDNRQIVYEHMDWTDPNRKGYYARNKAYIAAVSPLSASIDEDPIQVMFNGGVERMRGLAAALRALPLAPRFSLALTEYEPRDFSLLDVNAAGCTKGSTLARWAAANGFRREEVMAVGDNLNDITMLEFAGTAVVMGNAADTLKSRGFHLTGSNDEGGLADAIRDFVLQNRRSP
jgi:Cof subfamily protein (haloacid dehalogenase superfamily)